MPANDIGTDQTLPSIPSIIPAKRIVRSVAAGLSGVGVAAVVIYYLLTVQSAQGDRLRVVEGKVETITDTLSDVRDGQRQVLTKMDEMNKDLSGEVGALNAKVGRIEGYIAAQRDR